MGHHVLIAHNKNQDYGLVDKLKQFKSFNLTVTTVDDSSNLMEQLANDPPNVLILDSDLADDNRIQLLRNIKDLSSEKELPVILLTSFTNEEYLEEASKIGVVDFIHYNISDLELKLRIHSIIYRQQLNLKIKEQKDQINNFTLIANRTGNSIIVLNRNGDMEWVNEAFENVYGYNLESFSEKFGKNILNPDAFNQTTRENFLKCVRKAETVNYTNLCETKGNQSKWIRTTLSPVLDENNTTSKVIAIESDFTEVKSSEQSLEEKNKHLLSLTENLEYANKLLEQKNIEIESQKAKSDELLFNIFPREVANQLKRKDEAKTKSFKTTSVLFTDFKGFSALTKLYDGKDLIKELSRFFEMIDIICEKHFLEKIKTMGDAYMCVGGVPFRNNSNPINAVMAGLEIQHFMQEDIKRKRANNEPIWQLRLGVHTGEVIAGVIGKKKFAYDIWGDTVNTASRMESGGEVGKVNVSGDTYEFIKDYFDCSPRGKIKVKKSIEMDMYFVNRLLPEYSEDEKGVFPNQAFRKILATF